MVAMQKQVPVLFQAIGTNVSEIQIMQSRIGLKEKTMRRNERLVQDLMAQIQDEERQLQLLHQDIRHQTEQFCTEVCDGLTKEPASQRLAQLMSRLEESYNRLMDMRSGTSCSADL